MGNMELRRSKKAGTRILPQADPDLWEKGQWIDAYKKIIESYHWNKRRICAKEG